ncbi:hypothetical protein APHAL10511_004388 [Amanita phalloides]|nr:hypothetical protein APHAL10511_004388 [Amanita phalloides]
MMVNHVAENVLGTFGTVCWTIQLVPQIVKSWCESSTRGLSPWLMLIWSLTGAFFGTYAIVQGLSIPLIIQPQLFTLLSLVSWAQCLYYDRGYSKLRAVSAALATMILIGTFEVGMVYAIRPSYAEGDRKAVASFGILSSVLIAIGLLPQYWEIYKHRQVIGISLVFMSVDMAGGVFSDLSLAFRPEFDVLAAVVYTLVVVMDGIVLLAALVLNPRAARRKEKQAEDGIIEDNSDTKTEDATSPCSLREGMRETRPPVVSSLHIKSNGEITEATN